MNSDDFGGTQFVHSGIVVSYFAQDFGGVLPALRRRAFHFLTTVRKPVRRHHHRDFAFDAGHFVKGMRKAYGVSLWGQILKYKKLIIQDLTRMALT